MALRRDHRMHDRIYEPDEAERIRDMDNIRRDEARNAERARAMGLPDWSGWWPTLEELVARTPPVPRVALIVHSGGAPETWPERSVYLRQALASYGERLKLPRWERRVIWSDWGDERRAELDAIAEEHGLYVKGPEKRLGYTASMQAMWRYIARHVKAQWVLQAEDDFTVDRDVDVAAMVDVLQQRPHLVQMALLRGPLNDREREPDTILGHPCSEIDRLPTHLEHRHYFTANPAIMRTSLAVTEPWPDGPHSEAVYGRRLFRDPRARAGLWGQGEPWIRHLGETRAGGPY